MSKTRYPRVDYKCWNDCLQMGCPGHSLEVVINNTSDTVTLRLDGRVQLCIDHGEWGAIMEAIHRFSEQEELARCLSKPAETGELIGRLETILAGMKGGGISEPFQATIEEAIAALRSTSGWVPQGYGWCKAWMDGEDECVWSECKPLDGEGGCSFSVPPRFDRLTYGWSDRPLPPPPLNEGE